VELLSRFAGFPLQVTDIVTGTGYGVHSMGGKAWGDHTCPDLPPNHVRSHQRPAIIALAKQIRNQRTPKA
jgi:nucleoside phosphorylase